ncbi:MAG: restriction endonuclease subunit S [Pseudomonadota bacterium]
MSDINLPDSWLEIELSGVADVSSGIGFPLQHQGQSKGEIGFFKVGDISIAVKDNNGILENAQHYVSTNVAQILKGKPIKAGATVFAKIGEAIHLNRRAIVKTDCLVDNNVMSVKAKLGAMDKYVHYFLRTTDFSEQARSTTVPSIRKGDVETLQFPLAPLPEQKRIADKLDTVLARVDACRERLNRVPLILKRFKQSVLAAATSGKLTEDWRIKNVDISWADVKLEDVLREKPRNGYSPKAVDYETSVRSLTLSATTSGKFIGKHCKFIDESIPSTSHLWLNPGDILVQRANSLEYVGVSAIFDGSINTFIYPDLMMKCRANERILTSYLFIVLSAEATRNYFRENATGTAGNMPKINQQTVASVPVQLPPIEEQQEIVHRVETLFAFADRLEARLSTARNAAERLTPALLAKAFRGELVPQDPNDEPASLLLQRLAENQGITNAKPGRGRTSKKEAI